MAAAGGRRRRRLAAARRHLARGGRASRRARRRPGRALRSAADSPPVDAVLRLLAAAGPPSRPARGPARRSRGILALAMPTRTLADRRAALLAVLRDVVGESELLDLDTGALDVSVGLGPVVFHLAADGGITVTAAPALRTALVLVPFDPVGLRARLEQLDPGPRRLSRGLRGPRRLRAEPHRRSDQRAGPRPRRLAARRQRAGHARGAARRRPHQRPAALHRRRARDGRHHGLALPGGFLHHVRHRAAAPAALRRLRRRRGGRHRRPRPSTC